MPVHMYSKETMSEDGEAIKIPIRNTAQPSKPKRSRSIVQGCRCYTEGSLLGSRFTSLHVSTSPLLRDLAVFGPRRARLGRSIAVLGDHRE